MNRSVEERIRDERLSFLHECRCAKCRYDLTALGPDGTCPECAFPIAESIRILEERRAGWPERRRWFKLFGIVGGYLVVNGALIATASFADAGQLVDLIVIPAFHVLLALVVGATALVVVLPCRGRAVILALAIIVVTIAVVWLAWMPVIGDALAAR